MEVRRAACLYSKLIGKSIDCGEPTAPLAGLSLSMVADGQRTLPLTRLCITHKLKMMASAC